RSRYGIAIAILAGIVHLHRYAREALDHEFSGQSSMPTGSASGDVHFVGFAELFLTDFHLLQEDLAGILRYPSQSGIADCARLLIDFLEHEVLEAALFCLDGIPGHALRLALDRLAVEIGELDSGRRNHREVTIGQEEQIAGVMENGGNVGRHEVLILAKSNNRRRAVASSHDLVRLIG